MFNIIETLRNYFIHELLYNNLGSDVRCISLQRKLVGAIFGEKLFGGSVLPASAAPFGRLLTPPAEYEVPRFIER